MHGNYSYPCWVYQYTCEECVTSDQIVQLNDMLYIYNCELYYGINRLYYGINRLIDLIIVNFWRFV